MEMPVPYCFHSEI